MTRIGWYVHHHGRGHLTRFLAVRPWLHSPVTVFSTLERPLELPDETDWVSLPRDDEPVSGVDPRDADPTARGLFHWAPVAHPGHRRRLTMIADACADGSFDAFVVDVSVEVTLWVRLLGIPTVVVAQPGDRTDLPHELAYRAADRILAPWAAGMIRSAALEPVRDRVVWVGGVSRFDGREPRVAGSAGRAALVLGSVLPPASVDAIRAAAAEGWDVSFAGADAATWRSDPWPLITASTVVVSAAGQNSVADLAAAGARAVVIPQPRPFAEQWTTARALHAAQLAVVRDDSAASSFVSALEEASRMSPDWRAWRVAGAASRAARVVESVIR